MDHRFGVCLDVSLRHEVFFCRSVLLEHQVRHQRPTNLGDQLYHLGRSRITHIYPETHNYHTHTCFKYWFDILDIVQRLVF